jgi:putative membrane protein
VLYIYYKKNNLMKNIKQHLALVLKGVGMGAANVIPGVSGGTVALITGIFEELIDSIKSFNLVAIKLLLKGKFSEFSEYVNLKFLVAIFTGVAISIVSLAKALDFMFINYPIYIWAYFFGLILASIYFVGKTVHKWSVSSVISFLIGTAIAISISFLSPATENEAFIYLIICGVVAICSMILPGLSGSFVLILLGNYQLVVIRAINDFRIDILFPVLIGAAVGLIAFSHILSWIYKKRRDETISTLTGFILGSLAILWPWKVSMTSSGVVIPVNKFGAFIGGSGEILSDIKVFGYKQCFPESINSVVLISVALVLLGITSIWLMEKLVGQEKSN